MRILRLPITGIEVIAGVLYEGIEPVGLGLARVIDSFKAPVVAVSSAVLLGIVGLLALPAYPLLAVSAGLGKALVGMGNDDKPWGIVDHPDHLAAIEADRLAEIEKEKAAELAKDPANMVRMYPA